MVGDRGDKGKKRTFLIAEGAEKAEVRRGIYCAPAARKQSAYLCGTLRYRDYFFPLSPRSPIIPPISDSDFSFRDQLRARPASALAVVLGQFAGGRHVGRVADDAEGQRVRVEEALRDPLRVGQ